MPKFKPTREWYIPKGATKISLKSGAAVFYLFNDSRGRPCARCFIGRAQKPSWSYAYTSDAKRSEAIHRQIEAIATSAAAKAKRTAERNKPHNWEKGLILVSSWGYDQTNVDFYEVTAVIGKCFVEIEEIGSQTANDAGTGYSDMSSHVVPDPANRSGKKHRVKVQFGRSVSLSRFQTAHIWDGKPHYESWYA